VKGVSEVQENNFFLQSFPLTPSDNYGMMENMKRIKPSHYEVLPVYTCPECDMEHQQTIEETVFPAGILCYCGEKLRLETIQEVNVEATFKNRVSSKKDVVEEVSHEEVVNTLIGMGYKSNEAKSLVADFSAENQTSEELLEKIIARI